MSHPRYPRPEILRRLPAEGHAVIEASAGTGKTFTLEHLVVDLVISGRASISEILVVTFTEKATGELRARVRALLARLLDWTRRSESRADDDCWILDDTARARLQQALREFDSATLSTIHSFCQRVLTENAFDNDRLFREQLVDGREAFAHAFRETIRRDVAADPSRAERLRLWLENGSLDGLERLLHACASRRGRLAPTWDPEAARRAIAAFPRGAAAAVAAVAPAAGMKEATLVRRYEHAAECLASFPAGLREQLEWLERYRKKESGADGTWCGTLLAVAEAHAGADPALAAIAASLAALDDVLAELDAVLASELVPLVRERLQRTKRERGLFDFDDMLALVRDGLRGPKGRALAESLRGRYRYALIDEFQDTDELQWEIFRTLFFEGGGHTLYLIGDPKQAIYGFRGADVETYLRALDEILALGPERRVHLAENFRSTAPLIDAYNELLRDSEGVPYFTGRIRYDEPVRCGNRELALRGRDGGALAPIHVFEVEEPGGSVSKDRLLPGLARRIAGEIRALVDPERGPLWDDGSGPRPLRPADVFVLSRTGAESRLVGDVLREAGIPHAYYKQDGLFQTDEAAALCDVLAAVAEPGDRVRRLRAWATPFFRVPIESLAATAELPPDDPLIERLLGWQALARERRYEQLFDRILDESGVIRRCILDDRGDRALANYLHLCELLAAHVARSRCSLPELVAHLRALIDGRAAPDGESGDQQRLESERDAVQLMTMHASKGLEAPVVFVVGGTSQMPPDRIHTVHGPEGRATWVGRMPDRIAARVRDEARWEDERLLYVALTRAKARLYLSCHPSTPPGKLKGCHRVVEARLRAIREAGGDPALFSWEPLLLGAAPAPDGEARRAALRAYEPPAELLEDEVPDPDFERLRVERAGYLVTSYSRLRRGSRGAREVDPEEFTGEAGGAAEAPEDALPGGAATGIFLHELLALLPPEVVLRASTPEALLADEEGARIFREQGRLHGFGEPAWPRAAALVHAALVRPLVLGGRRVEGIARSERLLREMEFLYPIPERSHPRLSEPVGRAGFEIRRGFVTGFVDVIFEQDGLVYFGDWKSDTLARYDAPAMARHVEQSYALQAQLYSLALVKLLGIRDEAAYEARFGGLLYLFLRGLRPDGEGGEGVHFERPSFADVLGWEEALLRREDLGGVA